MIGCFRIREPRLTPRLCDMRLVWILCRRQERASQSSAMALLYLALGSFADTGVILATMPSAFVGSIWK